MLRSNHAILFGKRFESISRRNIRGRVGSTEENLTRIAGRGAIALVKQVAKK